MPLRSHVESKLLNAAIEKKKNQKSQEIKFSKQNGNWIVKEKIKKEPRNNKCHNSNRQSD